MIQNPRNTAPLTAELNQRPLNLKIEPLQPQLLHSPGPSGGPGEKTAKALKIRKDGVIRVLFREFEG